MAIEIKTSLSLSDIILQWCRQAGCFDASVPVEAREKKYTEALMGLLSLFAKHQEELDDGSFIRIFRFFKDTGLTKRLSPETLIHKRSIKLEHKEPE